MARKSKNAPPSPTPTVLAEQAEPIRQTAKYLIYAVDGIAALLAVFFVYLVLDYREITVFISTSAGKSSVYNISLFILYIALYYGAKFDITMQRDVLTADDLLGRLTRVHTISACVIVIIAFSVALLMLHYWKRDELIFSSMLILYVVANFYGWLLIVRQVTPAFEASRLQYRELNDYIMLEQVAAVQTYLCGRWQRMRF